MKAVTCQDATLELTGLPDPQPGRGQVVINGPGTRKKIAAGTVGLGGVAAAFEALARPR